MEQERRKFLNAAGTVGAAALLLPGSLFAQVLTANVTVQGSDYYTGRVREWFYLHSPETAQQGDLRLLRVEAGINDAIKQEFSLVLQSRRGALAMPAGYYEVSGEPFSLYIQHTHEKRSKQFYLAQFALLNTYDLLAGG